MAKRKPLVTQHLENVDRKMLEKYHNIIYGYIHRRQGIYALYRKGRLYYVGLTSNLRSRLRDHLKNKHGVKWDHFSVYLTIGDQHMKELEVLILRVINVKPKGNSVKGNFIKSKSLFRVLRRDMTEYHKREVDKLLKCSFNDEKDELDIEEPSGKKLELSQYVGKITDNVIRARYKGKWIKARVRRDGSINFNGKIYESPSSAGSAAVKGHACNGWRFWTYKRAPDDWVLLENLRD